MRVLSFKINILKIFKKKVVLEQQILFITRFSRYITRIRKPGWERVNIITLVGSDCVEKWQVTSHGYYCVACHVTAREIITAGDENSDDTAHHNSDCQPGTD